MRPGVKRTFTSTPASFAAFSTAALPPKNDQVGERDFLAAGSRTVELLLNGFQLLQHCLELGRLVHLPVLLRTEANCFSPVVNS
jgi:hypothetical protein